MNELIKYGAPQCRFDEAAAYPELRLARVLSQSHGRYRLVTEDGECAGEVSGKYRFEADSPELYPAVGDFVLIRGGGDGAVICRLLPRSGVFTRREPGDAHRTQVVAANVDTVFLCMALGENYNLSRLERYLSAAWSSGAQPVVVLTKADLCPDLPAKLAEVGAVCAGAPVYAVSNADPDSASALLPYLQSGMTASFVGSSGVGKSTLVNRLAGSEVMRTSAVRDDGKGRHTTTSRELLPLPSGGVVIDTPGMRELGVEAADLEKSFADIEALTERCRFSDCGHTREPGCAVLAAVRSGALDPRRLESWRKLRREAKYEGLNARDLENEKLNAMFGEVGGMKNVRKFIRQNDKRKGEK